MPDLILDSTTAIRRFEELKLNPVPEDVLDGPTIVTPTCGCFLGMLMLHHELPFLIGEDFDSRYITTGDAVEVLTTVGYKSEWLEGTYEGFDTALLGAKLETVGLVDDEDERAGVAVGYETGKALRPKFLANLHKRSR